jgi:hypothetical protein
MLVPSPANPSASTGDSEFCAPACLREASCRNPNRSIPAFRQLQSKVPNVRSARSALPENRTRTQRAKCRRPFESGTTSYRADLRCGLQLLSISWAASLLLSSSISQPPDGVRRPVNPASARLTYECRERPSPQGQMMSHGRSDHVSGAAFAFRTPLGTVEHPINQVLKFGLSASTLAHEVV